MRFVLDNSVAMSWLLKNGSQKDDAYAADVLNSFSRYKAVIPNLMLLEATNIILKAESKGFIDEAQSRQFLNVLKRLDLQIDLTTNHSILSDIFNLARQHKLSSYDAAYLELALRENLPLATLDDQLEKAAKKAGVKRFEPN